MTSSPLTRWAAAALTGVLLPLTLGVGAGLSPSADAAAVKRCGAAKKAGYTYAKRVTAKNTTCRNAKYQIFHYFLPGKDLNGFECEGYPRQTCTKRRVVIAFTYP